MTTKPHYDPGTNKDMAYVFSCPGRYEERCKKPAAGRTGINLNELIMILHERGFLFFPTRGEATITNASTKILYKGKDGFTEATDEEILDPDNLCRLAVEVGHIKKHIICFGNKAHLAISELKRNGKYKFGIIKARHLSMSSLNRIKKDINGVILEKGKSGNTRKRLEVIADEIIRQLKNPNSKGDEEQETNNKTK